MPRDSDDAVDDSVTDRIRSILPELEEADFELVDPPAEVWAGIAASVATRPVRSPKEPPSRDLPASTIVDYLIDADDVVIDVGQSWTAFARDNGAPELAVPASDRSLWTYFDGDEVRELWRLLVERVRRMETRAEVPFRCDAPDARRWFDMTVMPESDGRVRFRCVLVFEEPRSAVSLLDASSVRDDDLRAVPLCSWCGRGEHGSRWLDVEELVASARLLERTSMPPVTHGICGSCRDDMAAELLVPGRTGESPA